MLQDLDARQTAASEAAELYAKPVARRETSAGLPVLVGASVCVVAIAVGGALGWRYWQKTHPAQAAQKVARVVELPRTVQPARAVAPPPAAAVSQPSLAAHVGDAPAAVDAKRSLQSAESNKRKERSEGKPAHRTAKVKPVPGASIASAAAEKPAAAHKQKGTPPKASGTGKEETAAQKAEAAYRRGLASIQEGYVSDAVAALEQALQANPRHDAARQTLVSLLIENRRSDEAMRQLQTGLTLDPRQPALAMLLARLQIEHGGSGIETLTRTLPYVGSNGEYRAFLAGALQRQQRHREAAQQYQAALQAVPQNGVWWMGLGISLQAEKRNAEALDAFRKARATATLSPELLAFVDNKIQQLAR
jgi:MSHA biogenesis protein MshN